MGNNRVKILIVYQEMVLGGSSSNLLSLLHEMDYDRVSVDLLLRRNEGYLYNDIPKEVNILEPIIRVKNGIPYKMMLLTKPKLLWEKWIGRKIRKRLGVWAGVKYVENQDLEYTKDIPGEYDVAIGYLEGWTHTFIINHVHARKKIGYLHLDYKGAGLIPEYDRDTFAELDNIIFVAQKNKETFDECFPEYAHKSVVMPHLFSQKYIRESARMDSSDLSLDPNCINCITVCRIVFAHKGLDRVLRVVHDHRSEEIFRKFRWYVIGEGPDFGKMQKMIEDYGLTNQVFLLGTKDNAYAYELGMDLFLQPSHYEGKPAAVYEAMILGVPPLVTEYASAREQIEDGKEGMIVENSEQGVYKGLSELLAHPEKIEAFKAYMQTKNYGNTEAVEVFYRLIGA